MKILFVAQNLQVGGIQRALINKLKELRKSDKFSIDVFLFADGPLVDEIPKSINVYKGSLILRLVSTPFSVVKEKKNIIHLIIRILCMILVRIIGPDKFYKLLFSGQKKFDNYDVAISYFNDVQKGYFNRGTNQFVTEFVGSVKKIAWIHTDPIKAGFEYKKSFNLYKKFDKVVCVSNACRQKFIELLPEFKIKTNVVYNFFHSDEIKSKAKEYVPFKKGNISIISVGRIENKTKRFNFIPQICKMLKNEGITNFRWRIVGNGPDIEVNKELAEELGVSHIVEFVGGKLNPYPYIKESDIFVLTSEYEGYPMVVTESLILGTPILTTKYAAASEQIINGYNGFITELEIESIYMKLKYFLDNLDILHEMRSNITSDEYSNGKVLEQFLQTIEE